MTWGIKNKFSGGACHGSQDDVGRLAPDEGLWIGIVRVDVVADGLLKIRDAGVCVAFDPPLADLAEEPLHQVEPGGRGRREVHVVARPRGEPCAHLFGLVRAVVVHDQMDVLIRRHGRVNRLQKLQKLRTTMPSLELPDDLAGGHIQCGKQRRGAVPLVVVGACPRLAEGQWQSRLRAIQCLDLALFVDTQYQRAIERRQIQAHDIAHLVDKVGIDGEFEGRFKVRLQSKRIHIRCTVGADTPVAALMLRTLQWVAWAGLLWRTLSTTACT